MYNTTQMLTESHQVMSLEQIMNMYLLAVEKNYPLPLLHHRNNLPRTEILWEPVLVCNHSHMAKKLFPLIKSDSLPLLHSNGM